MKQTPEPSHQPSFPEVRFGDNRSRWMPILDSLWEKDISRFFVP
jgi:hypothetical protein